MRRLGTALYAKAGGTPWKLATHESPLDPDTAYIGLSYAIRSTYGMTGFVTCCSQVFDSDGGGMEFVAYDVGQGTDLRNPYLSREDIRLVMSRSLALYQDRHTGRSPKRLVVHKQNPFQEQEIAGCTDAWGATTTLSCINITRPPWRGVTLDAARQQGKPAEGLRRRPRHGVPARRSFHASGWPATPAPRRSRVSGTTTKEGRAPLDPSCSRGTPGPDRSKRPPPRCWR